MSGTFLSTWNETDQLQGSNLLSSSASICLPFFFSFQHLSLFPAVTTGSSEDLLSDALVTFDAFGVNCSLNQSSEAGLLPHVSLFDGTCMAGSSDLELNTENGVTPPNSYQNNNTPQGLYDDIYDLSEDDIGSYSTFEKHPLEKSDHSNDESSDLAVDFDIDCLLEEPDATWQIGTHHWSQDGLPSQEYEQDTLRKIPSPGACFMAQPLKMPTSLYLPTALDIIDPLHSGYGECGLPDLDHLLRKYNLNTLASFLMKLSHKPRTLYRQVQSPKKARLATISLSLNPTCSLT